MNLADCFLLGFVSRTFGYKGECLAHFDVDDPQDYHQLESVFLLLEGKLIPFFIEHIGFKPHSREAIIRFQGVDEEEKAARLCGKEMYLPLAVLPPLSGKRFYFHEITGFAVVDRHRGPIGEVRDVLDLPGNPVLLVQYQQWEIMIPARDEVIERIDRDKRILHIHAPEGLIDLYLPS